jgi:hypothetical protein
LNQHVRIWHKNCVGSVESNNDLPITAAIGAFMISLPKMITSTARLFRCSAGARAAKACCRIVFVLGAFSFCLTTGARATVLQGTFTGTVDLSTTSFFGSIGSGTPISGTALIDTASLSPDPSSPAQAGYVSVNSPGSVIITIVINGVTDVFSSDTRATVSINHSFGDGFSVASTSDAADAAAISFEDIGHPFLESLSIPQTFSFNSPGLSDNDFGSQIEIGGAVIYWRVDTFTLAEVPEPSALALISGGLVMIAALRRRQSPRLTNSVAELKELTGQI